MPDQFLTERQVGDQFNVSRATANKALSNLVSEGVLEFRKGVGTFLRGGILDYDLRSLVSFTEKARAAGMVPATRVLCLEVLLAKEAEFEITDKLRVNPDEVVYYIERLRLADGQPVILENRYVVRRFCPDLSEQELAGSLYALWTDKYKLDIVGADQTIRALSIDAPDAELLDHVPGRRVRVSQQAWPRPDGTAGRGHAPRPRGRGRVGTDLYSNGRRAK